MGASSKTIHLRLAIAAADEELVFCWQIVLLRHFVLFTHTSSQSPGTRRGREAACSTGTGGRNQIPAHDRVILVHNNKLPAAWCGVVVVVVVEGGGQTIPHQLQPILRNHMLHMMLCSGRKSETHNNKNKHH